MDIALSCSMKSQLNILIADDSPFIIDRLKVILEEIEMITIVGAVNNGIEALNFLKTWTPDVVLLDVIMPGLNGIDVLSDIKKQYPGVKVIMLTNQSNPFVRKVCMNLGASYFFDKSTEFEKLPEALQQLAVVNENAC
jgi:DNA-binding NarL/FixJ family response regulator